MIVNPECSPIRAFEDKIYRESRCEQIAITFTSLRPEGMEAYSRGSSPRMQYQQYKSPERVKEKVLSIHDLL